MRYLWSLGYYIRRNVPLTETWEKSEQTDIDVLGVKLDQEFNSEFVVCDCKGGVTNSTKTRLFWLSGVMRYFGASRGIFVRSQMIGTKYIELANSLGIVTLSESQLLELEKAYEVDPSKQVGPFNKDHTTGESLLTELREKNKDLYEYLRNGYWVDPPHQQILSIFSRTRKLIDEDDGTDNSTTFQLAYVLSMLSLSVLRLSRGILNVPQAQREEVARLSLLGGKIGYTERTQLLEGFYDFMVREIETRYKAKFPISRRQFAESVVPPFSKYLADLMVRFCQRPMVAIALPRIMELISYDVVLSGDPARLRDIQIQYPSLSAEQISRIAKDYWAFVERSGLSNPYLGHILERAISDLSP